MVTKNCLIKNLEDSNHPVLFRIKKNYIAKKGQVSVPIQRMNIPSA